MPVKAKNIKDLPLKNEFDGSESLLVQDSNGTKQAPLEVIVDEIKQNSQEKIREIESEVDEIKQNSQEKIREIESELNQTNVQLSQKVTNYSNVSLMKKDVTLKSNCTVVTHGYFNVNDGGGATYIIRQKQDGDIEDGGYIHFLDNSLVAEMIVDGNIDIKSYGAIADGVTDNREIFQKALNSDFDLYVSKGDYYISDNLVASKNKKIVGDVNSKLIFEKNTSNENINQKSFIELRNVTKFLLKGITITSNFDWYERNVNNFDQYFKDRLLQANSLAIIESSNVVIENCKIGYGRVGVFVAFSNHCNILNTTLTHTMADGIFISDASFYINVSNCHAEYVNDDCFASDGYSADKLPHHNSFIGCTAKHCAGHLIAFVGTTYCEAIGCSAEKLKRFPFDIHNMNNDTMVKNILISDCTATVQDDVIGVEQISNGDDNFIGCFPIGAENVILKNVSVYRNAYKDGRLICNYLRNVTMDGCYIEGFNFVFKNFTDLKIINSTLKATDYIPFIADQGFINHRLIIDNNLFYTENVNTQYGVARYMNVVHAKIKNNMYRYKGYVDTFDVYGGIFGHYDNDYSKDIEIDNIPNVVFNDVTDVSVSGTLVRKGLQTGSMTNIFKSGTQLYDTNTNLLYLIVDGGSIILNQ